MLKNKKILIFGLANKFSIAFAIAKSMNNFGAKLALTYQNDRLKNRVEQCAKKLNTNIILPCDVQDEKNIKNLFINIKNIWKKFDGFVHCIAYAPADQLSGSYINSVTKEGFRICHDISSYSFVAIAKYCQNILNANSSLITISYIGSQIAVPNYNVMGLAKASLEANVKYMAYDLGKKNIRVNAISSGPIKTLAASGIKNFKKILNVCKKTNPICRLINSEEVGNTAAFLCSNLSSGITGQIIYVDGGFNISAPIIEEEH